MIGTHSAFDDVKGFIIPIRPLPQDLSAHIAGKNGVGKRRSFLSNEITTTR